MESIWTEIPLPHFPAVESDLTTDVLIIGGGMAGILCAYYLQKAGVDYILAEADEIGSGVTRNTTAKITAQHGLCYHKLLRTHGVEAAKRYLDANLAALAAYRSLCGSVDCDYSEQAAFVYSRDNIQCLAREQRALERLSYPSQLVRSLPLPFPTAGGIRFPNQGQFHPRKFLAHIARNLNIREHSRILQLAKGVGITDHGRIRARRILIATHFPFLNKHGSYFLKLYQHRSYCLALEGVDVPEGMYVDAQQDGLSFRSQGPYLILGGGGHRTGKPCGGWSELEAFAARYYPKGRIRYRWATQDCMSLDGIPYIGQYSARTPGMYVAAGFNKWGMTASMAAAQLLTDQLTGKANPNAALFSPSRSILHPQLGLNALESAKNLLAFTGKRCPHLGCALKWNPQEHSWDCPCHGSRFDSHGKLLDNPATSDLKISKQPED